MPAWEVDNTPENSDWLRVQRWGLPPYKSSAFMAWLQSSAMTLEEFRRTPKYHAAVSAGLINSRDEWTGRDAGV